MAVEGVIGTGAPVPQGGQMLPDRHEDIVAAAQQPVLSRLRTGSVGKAARRCCTA
jgi:hypothetical protein